MRVERIHFPALDHRRFLRINGISLIEVDVTVLSCLFVRYSAFSREEKLRVSKSV